MRQALIAFASSATEIATTFQTGAGQAVKMCVSIGLVPVEPQVSSWDAQGMHLVSPSDYPGTVLGTAGHHGVA